MISFNPLWRHQIESFPRYCPFVRETTCQFGFSSQRVSNAELCCFCCQSEQTLDWPVFRDAMAVIWRRRNVLNWIVSMVVAGGPTPIWHQDILKRHGEIGQLYIYRYAILLSSGISCFAKDSNVAQCKRITESVKLCVLQGRKVTIVTDHLDNAWFSVIATSSLSIEKKTPLQMDVTAAMLSLSLHGIILAHSFFTFFVIA